MRAKNQAWRTALAGAWLAAAGVAAEGSPPPPPMLGQAAPPFELRDVRGGTVSLASLRGRFLVLHFGASW